MINNFFSGSGNIRFTPEGGLAIKLINNTGVASVKGELVNTSFTIDNAVEKLLIGDPDPIGVFYESGVLNGKKAWIVIAGIADVYYIGSTTRGDFARMCDGADIGPVAGQAIGEPVPSPPLSTNRHFLEIGHLLESRVGAGLAKTVLHFN